MTTVVMVIWYYPLEGRLFVWLSFMMLMPLGIKVLNRRQGQPHKESGQ